MKDSEIIDRSCSDWPEPDRSGKQELELVLNGKHTKFTSTKFSCFMDVEKSKDPEGLKVFYYLIQDLKCFIFSLINLHFKPKIK